LRPAEDRNKVEKEGGTGYHTFSNEETKSFADIISFSLQGDADLADLLPIDSETDALFGAVGNGILLCKMINNAVPGTIDPRAINTKKPLNIFQIKENLTLAISSAKAIGCVIISITPPLIIEKREHIILGILWQILRIRIASNINLKNHPYLIRLKHEDEELADLLKLPAEELLLRWFNYHLKNAGHNRKVNNFSGDIKDGINYTVLLNQLDADKCDKTGLDMDEEKRANKVITDTKKLGVPPFVRGSDIRSGNPKLNLMLCAEIFNNCPGLLPTEQELIEAAGLLNDDIGDSREERSFRMWVNSLNIENVYVNNLYEDIKDGLVLLKVLERIEPGIVDWKKAEMKPSIKLKKVHNCNYSVDIGKQMKFSLVGIGGVDLFDGKKKLTLALIWQMVRKYTLALLGGWNEEKLLEWAVQRVPKEPKITSFKDKTIPDCKFLFNLICTIEPKIINWDLVTQGTSPEEIENNCKYVISAARKLGATIFLVWEDIKDVNPKMIMTLVAALAHLATKGKQEEMPDITHKTDQVENK
jgi:plastin-1